MKIPKIRNSTEARKNFFEMLREVQEGEPQIITSKGSDAVVVISQTEMNRLIEKLDVLQSIAAARADVEAGHTFSSEEAKQKLEDMQKQWLKQK